MMKHSFFFLIIGASILSLFIGVSRAEETDRVDECETRMIDDLITKRDTYRMTVFGSKKDINQKEMILTGGSATKEQNGIFETPERMTSELVEPLVESYRVLDCSLQEVCSHMLQSIRSKEDDTTVDVHILGCTPRTLPIMTECQLNTNDSSATAVDVLHLQDRCKTLVADSLEAEQAILKLAVSYDSGYRSMLQSAGNLEDALSRVNGKTIRPLQKMVNLLGTLHQIPCFITQCDHPRTP